MGKRVPCPKNLVGFIFFFSTSVLEYNCFTMVCQFLLHSKVNQLHTYICSHISSLLHLPPSHPPYPTPLGGHKPPSWSPCAMQLPPTSHPFYIWLGFIFIIKGKVGRGRRPPSSSFLSRHKLPSSAPPPRQAGEFSCPYTVKQGLLWSNGNEQKGSNIY